MPNKLINKILDKINPEFTHDLVLKTLSKAPFLVEKKSFNQPAKLLNLDLPNRLGLAAGLDKNAIAIDAFDRMGFGFIEVGTVTPYPQKGNPKPRLFRLSDQNAIINRMGFNNKGVDFLCEQIEQVRKKNISAKIGINLGKNKETSNNRSLNDYLIGLQKTHHLADYITINISSPNTKNLRELQNKDQLSILLDGICNKNNYLNKIHQKKLAIVIKIAPDLTDRQIEQIAKLVDEYQIDGIIATNTTISRTNIAHHKLAKEQGGLSGAPLSEMSTRNIKTLRKLLPHKTIIASGGIMSAEDAKEKITAGADLIQIYSGLVYHGTKLIDEIQQQIKQLQIT